ncbi:hypothetical protein [Dactylosporangium sp. NPDC051484]|uniref:hypothetical protein n=1 Tax=Dactylosporangium sp. NPDC051484 TaxID=3154942 RepID=UPI00344E92AD
MVVWLSASTTVVAVPWPGSTVVFWTWPSGLVTVVVVTGPPELGVWRVMLLCSRASKLSCNRPFWS